MSQKQTSMSWRTFCLASSKIAWQPQKPSCPSHINPADFCSSLSLYKTTLVWTHYRAKGSTHAAFCSSPFSSWQPANVSHPTSCFLFFPDLSIEEQPCCITYLFVLRECCTSTTWDNLFNSDPAQSAEKHLDCWTLRVQQRRLFFTLKVRHSRLHKSSNLSCAKRRVLLWLPPADTSLGESCF